MTDSMQTIEGLSKLISDRKVSCVELTKDTLEKIKAHNEQINAFISITEDEALAEAKSVDARIDSMSQREREKTSLLGVPIAHKDIFCTKNIRTTCASKMLSNFISPYDATVVSNLREAGMVMVGKTNMDEFAMGSSNETSWFGPVKNPWNEAKVPGGSSGGSAAAVAARLVCAATGTDTGGSIRQPASFSGVTGMKPTYGRVSRWGIIAFASSLDQAGSMAASSADCALLLNAMSGHDAKDSTSSTELVDDYYQALMEMPKTGPLKGVRIGLPKEYVDSDMSDSVQTAFERTVKTLTSLGAAIIDVSLPSTALSVPSYYVIAPIEASSNLARFDGIRYGYRTEKPIENLHDLYSLTRSEGFGTEVKRRILIGTYILGHGNDASYLKAQEVRRLISDDFKKVFETCDVLLTPTTPTTAFGFAEKQDPVQMYLSDIYTIATNLAGLPSLSMPCGFDENSLPIGAQLIGPWFKESSLLKAAHAFQQVTDFHLKSPILGGGNV